jgi:hypothetical protein
MTKGQWDEYRNAKQAWDRKKERLEADGQFKAAWIELKACLNEAHEKYPNVLPRLLSSRRTTGALTSTIGRDLRKLPTILRKALEASYKFSSRFRVQVSFHDGAAGPFKYFVLPPDLPQCRVDGDGKRFLKFNFSPCAPPKIKALIEQDLANYVTITQKARESGISLRQLESVMYDPYRFTFVVFEDAQPRLWLLIGENVKKGEAWRKAEAGITEFQKKYYKRGGGRGIDVRKLELADAQLSKPTRKERLQGMATNPDSTPEGDRKYLERLEKN